MRVVHLAMADCIYEIALHTHVLWHPRDIPNVRGEFLLLAASCDKLGLSCVRAGPVGSRYGHTGAARAALVSRYR